MILLAFLLVVLAAAVGDQRLVKRALAGHRGAMRLLVRRLDPVVRARVRRRLGGWTDEAREDAAQEAWTGLLAHDGRGLRGYDADRGVTLEGYVGMLVERTVVSWVRREGAAKRGAGATVRDERALERAVATDDPEATAVAGDLARALGDWLRERLPEIGRLVFRLCYTDGHPPAEAARLLNVNRQVVYNWQHKVRAEVRAFLAAQEA